MAFLVFEGIDSSGKSTLLRLLAQYLKQKKLDFVQTKEPGGSPIGAKIRDILLEKQNHQLTPLAETLLYYADRKQHVEEVIKTNLKKNVWILSDRYWASTSAYQCGGRGIDEDFVKKLHKITCSGYEPDLWILLDLPLKEALKRKTEKDRMEMSSQDFYQRVKNYYLKLAKQNPSRWLVLNALQTPEELLKQLLSHLNKKGLI